MSSISNPNVGPGDPEVANRIQVVSFMASAEMFLYGTYVVLFGFYVSILRKPGEFRKNSLLHSATIALFTLCTIHLALLLSIAAGETRSILLADVHSLQSSAWPEKLPLIRAAFGVYVTSNVIADSLFVFRCYAIWGFRSRIIIVPTFWTMGIAGLGYWHVSQGPALLLFGQSSSLFTINVISLSNTILLVILSAGRIWWLARMARKIMGYERPVGRYYTVCAMILESGALYGIGASLMVGMLATGQFNDYVVVSGTITGQLVGLAPTMIAVRVGLNRSVESVDSFIIAVERPRRHLPSMNFHSKNTGPIEPPAVVYLRPDSFTEAQKIQTV
ncbi:hypothetical protein FB45DRAFT_938226 [Roridomyces roridus]|uniref:Uncharacterized protein n=1 Tax=Roridomyces roridus TaxID=1738132 RepID=A0AAD7B8M1_9AGAR|nr:hypothetical protein FB45DRAFT_938226 [Roridomyces roridus]